MTGPYRHTNERRLYKKTASMQYLACLTWNPLDTRLDKSKEIKSCIQEKVRQKNPRLRVAESRLGWYLYEGRRQVD